MWDIAFVDKLARVLYPLIAALAAYLVRRRNKKVDRRLDSIIQTQTSEGLKVNGRLDELIRAKEEIAYSRGRADAMAEFVTAKLEDKP